jgi:hypothetical protein
MNPKGVIYENVDWIQVAQDKVQLLALVIAVRNRSAGSIKSEEYVHRVVSMNC